MAAPIVSALAAPDQRTPFEGLVGELLRRVVQGLDADAEALAEGLLRGEYLDGVVGDGIADELGEKHLGGARQVLPGAHGIWQRRVARPDKGAQPGGAAPPGSSPFCCGGRRTICSTKWAYASRPRPCWQLAESHRSEMYKPPRPPRTAPPMNPIVRSRTIFVGLPQGTP